MADNTDKVAKARSEAKRFKNKYLKLRSAVDRAIQEMNMIDSPDADVCVDILQHYAYDQKGGNKE